MCLLVALLCSLQCVSDVGCPSASAQSVGKLFVEDIGHSAEGTGGIDPVHDDATVSAYIVSVGLTSSEVIPDVLQGGINTGHPSADYTDYLAGDERYDWCAGYALYRYTLEVNGVEEFKIPQWKRSLRRYCSTQTKSRNGVDGKAKHGAEWQADNSNWRTIFDIGFIPQFQGAKSWFVDFQDREIADLCSLVEWGDDLSRNRLLVSESRYGDLFTLNQSLGIGYDVKGGDDPTVLIDDKSTTVHSLSINLDDRASYFLTGIDLSEWLRQVLAVNCGADKEHNDDQTAQPHRVTHARVD